MSYSPYVNEIVVIDSEGEISISLDEPMDQLELFIKVGTITTISEMQIENSVLIPLEVKINLNCQM